MQNRSSPLASVYFLALAATLAAAIPVLVYLILNHESGDPSASSAVRSIPDAALVKGLSRLSEWRSGIK